MRPLKLQEALKKVAVGIKKDRMVNGCMAADGALCVVMNSSMHS
jgi:hypothetical protein